MKTRGLKRTWAPVLTLLAIGAGLTTALADDHARLPERFSGLLNDYTGLVTNGPYEMHGKWSLLLNQRRAAASFSAEMTMETADFANPDPNHDPTKLGAHVHHISMPDGLIHDDPTDPINWQTVCPTLKPPAAGGFVITGNAYVTVNGANPPFANPSSITICILGGMRDLSINGTQAFVSFSNLTLTFASGSPASGHFGTQPIHGVVVRCAGRSDHDAGDCRVSVTE